MSAITWPGHPIVIACIIMREFGPEALQNPDEIVKSSKIRGSGTNVWKAIDLIRYVRVGILSSDDACIQAHEHWVSDSAVRYSDHLMPGLREAVACTKEFLSVVETWRIERFPLLPRDSHGHPR